VVIRWPTLRTNSSERPGSVTLDPSGAVTVRSASSARVSVLPPLSKLSVQIAAHQPQPIGIGCDLVLGIDRRDRILEIDDGGQRSLEHDVGDARRIVLADRMRAIEHHLDVQAIVAEQPAFGALPDILRRIGQRDAAAGIAQIGP
jgi:hypothetical protein